MVKEDYCSFELTKLLKEKGFDQISDWGYREDGTCVEMIDYPTTPPTYWGVTLQMAMKWLREECNIFISIVFCTYPTEKRVTWTPEISTFDSVFPESAIEYDSYEEACESAINYCFENLI